MAKNSTANKVNKNAKKGNFVQSVLGVAEEPKKLNEYLSNNESMEDAVSRVLLTGILKNQYHRSADNAAKEAVPLFKKAAETNPTFLLKALCFARKANMKGMLKVALACLFGIASPEFLLANKTPIISVLSTFHPGQLLQFVELCKSKQLGRGFGSRAQKLVGKAIASWGYAQIETYTLKYPTALNQLLRLTHSKISDEKAKLFSYVLTDLPGQKRDIVGKSQRMVEALKKLDNKDLVASQMLEFNIPWDVVKGFAGMDGPIARSCLRQMGLTALLLNLRSLDEKGALKTAEDIEVLQSKMNQVKNGRSVPIDFAKPYIHSTNNQVKDILLGAMADTLDISMPELEGKNIGVSVDISGSMQGEPLVTAGLLAIPFLKSKNLWFTTFDTSLYEEGIGQNRYATRQAHPLCPRLKGLGRKVQIRNLLSLQTNGGTDVSLALVDATKNKRKLDVMVLITDEEQNSGTKLITAWANYKRQVNPEAVLWVINAQNTEWHSADFKDPSIVVYQSMTPAIFKNLQYVGQNLVDSINAFNLNDESNFQNRQQEQKVQGSVEAEVEVEES